MITKFDLHDYHKKSDKELLEYFDSLQPIDKDEMVGIWKFYDIDTGHNLNSFSALTNWYGKIFLANYEAHGVVFRSKEKSNLLMKINPKGFYITKYTPRANNVISFLFDIFVSAYEGKKSSATLRNLSFRGKNSAAMVYNEVDIIDYYRRIDSDMTLGVLMSPIYKNKPFFFILVKDRNSQIEFRKKSKSKSDKEDLNTLKEKW